MDLLSRKLLRQDVSIALSSHFPVGLTKRQSNASHRLVRNYLFFVCLCCVWPFGFTSRIKGTGMRHKLFLWLSGCAIRTPWGESAVADVLAKVRGTNLALSLLWETWWMRHKDAKVIKAESGNPALQPLHLKNYLGGKNKQERKYYSSSFYSDGPEISVVRSHMRWEWAGFGLQHEKSWEISSMLVTGILDFVSQWCWPLMKIAAMIRGCKILVLFLPKNDTSPLHRWKKIIR